MRQIKMGFICSMVSIVSRVAGAVSTRFMRTPDCTIVMYIALEVMRIKVVSRE